MKGSIGSIKCIFIDLLAGESDGEKMVGGEVVITQR